MHNQVVPAVPSTKIVTYVCIYMKIRDKTKVPPLVSGPVELSVRNYVWRNMKECMNLTNSTTLSYCRVRLSIALVY